MKGTRVLFSKKTFENNIKVPVTKHTVGMTLQTWFTGERKAPRVLGEWRWAQMNNSFVFSYWGSEWGMRGGNVAKAPILSCICSLACKGLVYYLRSLKRSNFAMTAVHASMVAHMSSDQHFE